MRQLPTETVPAPFEDVLKLLTDEKNPNAPLLVWVPVLVTAVVWLTVRNPSLMVVLPLRLWIRSELRPVLASEQVFPLAATGIVTELLTMFPLTMVIETKQPAGTSGGIASTTRSTPGNCDLPR